MKRLRLVMKIMIVLLIIGVFVLADRQGEISSNVVADEGLKVGVLAPMTGPAASLGEHFVKGLELAIDPSIELIVEDSKSNAGDSVTAVKKLIEIDDVDVLVSVQASISMAIAAIAEQNEVPLLASIVSSEEFTRDYDYAFNIFPLPKEEARACVEFIRGFERAGVMTLADEYGKNMNLEFHKQFAGEVVANEEYGVLDTDYSTQLLKIKDSGADVIYFVGYPGHTARFVEHVEKLGIKTMVISSMQLQGELVRNTVGDLLHDEMFSVTPVSTLESGETESFFSEFRQQYGKEPDWAAPFGYDVALVLNRVDGDVLTSLRDIEVQGLNGRIKFNEFGESAVPLTVVRAKDKKVVE